MDLKNSLSVLGTDGSNKQKRNNISLDVRPRTKAGMAKASLFKQSRNPFFVLSTTFRTANAMNIHGMSGMALKKRSRIQSVPKVKARKEPNSGMRKGRVACHFMYYITSTKVPQERRM